VALFAKRGRRVVALGAAGLGACAVLAACGPVQAGAAAIVGDQRISVSSLDTQVSNLKTAAKPYSQLPITTAEMPTAVLSWLIRFAVMDQVAATNGITVSQSQSEAALASLKSVATQNQFSSTAELLIANGIPPQLFPEVGQWEAQQTAYALKLNNGKPPSTTAEQNAFSTAISKSQCQAAKSLNIKVSPQFGRLDYTQYTVVATPNVLSQPAGKPTPASTTGLAPAC
jgi:peptidyl-prolyl cis-trans isomerase SurA